MKEAGLKIDQWSLHIDSICLSLYKRWFYNDYNDDFISNNVFYSPNSFYKVYLTALTAKENRIY